MFTPPFMRSAHKKCYSRPVWLSKGIVGIGDLKGVVGSEHNNWSTGWTRIREVPFKAPKAALFRLLLTPVTPRYIAAAKFPRQQL